MTPAVETLPTAPPDDPVRAALDDTAVAADLTRHALGTLNRWLADRPPTVRIDAAAEAVQQTAERALKSRRTFDPRLNVAAWLHGILNRVLMELCRKLRKQPAKAPADPADWDRLASQYSGAASDDGLPALAAVLHGLPDDQRRIIEMAHLENLSNLEIAARLGLSTGNARVKLYRAMTALKNLAARQGEGDQ